MGRNRQFAKIYSDHRPCDQMGWRVTTVSPSGRPALLRANGDDPEPHSDEATVRIELSDYRSAKPSSRRPGWARGRRHAGCLGHARLWAFGSGHCCQRTGADQDHGEAGNGRPRPAGVQTLSARLVTLKGLRANMSISSALTIEETLGFAAPSSLSAQSHASRHSVGVRPNKGTTTCRRQQARQREARRDLN